MVMSPREVRWLTRWFDWIAVFFVCWLVDYLVGRLVGLLLLLQEVVGRSGELVGWVNEFGWCNCRVFFCFGVSAIAYQV